ncbi:MAG: 3-hydroxyisobutyrate dehydrogenase [Alphaproteobacteria bacterium]|nr:3-hydroxyisobutyrate dehydrogenase [Alphaproteobacteria bacterium]
MTNIGFIGLGNMGGPMAQNLVKAGFAVTAHDIVPQAVQKLAEAGATPAATTAETVKNADIVITMLPAGEHVETAYLGAGGILENAKPGALLIDCSTINAQTARQVAAAAKGKGFDMLDAPVSGGTAGAAAGTLTFIIGGDDAALERARPVLEKMGKNIMHAGKNGAGQVAKICNNMLLGVMMIGTAEALNMGAKNGLDPKTLSGIMAKSSGRNWALEVYNPMPGVMENVPAARGYEGGFGTDLMLKDLTLAQAAAEAGGAETPLGKAAREIYARHSADGHGKLDFSSIQKHFSGDA